MRHGQNVAVLGSGIMGSSLALHLARRGYHVTLFEQSSTPFDGASRWNEGKIHLGYLYAADPTLATARHMLPGSLSFRREVEALVGGSIEPAITRSDDVYLCHRDSVVSAEAQWLRLQEIDRIVREMVTPEDYLVDLSHGRCSRLRRDELDAVSGSEEIDAGFRVPERSVATHWIADLYIEALAAEPRIEIVTNFRVEAVTPAAGQATAWHVRGPGQMAEPFDAVFNALWEGRLAIDIPIGLPRPDQLTHRYRRALFIRSKTALEIPSAIVTTGPFGDMKNYNGRDFYLSWYPAGLAATGTLPEPPAVEPLDGEGERALIEQVFQNLVQLIPAVASLRQQIESIRVGGGWVYADSGGELTDPAAGLHRRSTYGVRNLGSYYSIDTGKYCTAPWMARQIVEQFAAQ